MLTPSGNWCAGVHTATSAPAATRSSIRGPAPSTATSATVSRAASTATWSVAAGFSTPTTLAPRAANTVLSSHSAWV